MGGLGRVEDGWVVWGSGEDGWGVWGRAGLGGGGQGAQGEGRWGWEWGQGEGGAELRRVSRSMQEGGVGVENMMIRN